MLFSHPKDYTPVCTTELGRVANLKEEFAKRKVKVIALSVDSVDDHKGWINDINETQQLHCGLSADCRSRQKGGAAVRHDSSQRAGQPDRPFGFCHWP